jgi:thiol-disulfide isomerase/thioredoxin
MYKKPIPVMIILVLALLLAACSPAVEKTMDEAAPAAEMMEKEMPADEMAEKPMDDMGGEKDEMGGDEMAEKPMDDMAGEKDEMSGDEMEKVDEMMVDTPDWFKAELVNAATGETFRIEDYHGKVILVETMAMWCSNCLKQQQQVKALHDLLGDRADFVSIALDIDVNEERDMLAKYAERNGFDWIYAVVPAEVGSQLGNLYGNQFLNPPAVPMLIIDPRGAVHLLPFGVKSADSLLEALEPFFDKAM